MKKRIVFLSLFFALSFFAFGQEAEDVQLAADTTETVESEAGGVPDPLCVVVDNQQVCFPTNDAEQAAAIIREFVEGKKGNWPKNIWGIITMVVGFLLSAQGTALLSNATRVYYFLREFLRKTLHVVAFVAGVFAAGVSFVIGAISGDGFSWQVFTVAWPSVSFLAVYVYETFIKKDAPETEQPQGENKPETA